MNTPHTVKVGNHALAADRPFALIAGPCAIESAEHSSMMAHELKAICAELDVPFIFKSSFDKANRTSAASERGIGFERGLQILADIRSTIGEPVLTDVHESWQCAPTSEAVDVIQIPAFLCRQTDLLAAAAATPAAVNVKKGQFLAPWDMANV
ncbi:MAG: 3-deoxy-8-phosphooctulonate synthase, partial [Pseudomonadota bacterium]